MTLFIFSAEGADCDGAMGIIAQSAREAARIWNDRPDKTLNMKAYLTKSEQPYYWLLRHRVPIAPRSAHKLGVLFKHFWDG